MYVVTGSGHVWLEGQQLPITAGDIVYIPTGAAHATVPEPGRRVELMCFFPHPDLSSNIVETDIAVVRDSDHDIGDPDHHIDHEELRND